MVEYELLAEGTDDLDCDVTVRGTRAEIAEIGLKDCDLRAEYVEPLIEGFEIGTGVSMRLYRPKEEHKSNKKDKRIVTAGGDSMGSIGIRFNTMDNDAELYHFLIDEPYRGKGLAKVLFKIFIGLCELDNVEDIRMNIGNGEDTIGWLEHMGVPKGDMHIAGQNLARVHTKLSSIDYDDLEVTVKREDIGR